MKDELITYETALLAKEKGYTLGLHLEYYATTQSLLQTWLREKHKIHIFIGFRPNVKKWDSHAYDLNLSGPEYAKSRPLGKFFSQQKCDSYEDALEGGLQEALKLI